MSFRYGLLVLAALSLAAPALAQESFAVLSAKQHLQALATDASLAGDDLADLRARDVYPDRRTGATMVYLVQHHRGIEVYGAVAPVAVLPDGKTHGLSPRRFEAGLVSRVNTTEPRMSAGAARSSAEAHVRALVASHPAPEVPVLTDDPAADAAPRVTTTYEATEPRLVYEPTASGALRLAWLTTLTADAGALEMWAVRVDALTGEVLAADDLVARDRWHAEEPGASVPSFAPLATDALAAPVASPAGGASYRVIPWPAESPIHGAFSVVTDPADATASPNGWHDTGIQTYTTTRGNNVWAYPNRNQADDPAPDTEGVPDGGAGLTFDATYDETLNPEASTAAATTNLFYWGNIFHDVTYQYGFDEAAGNFQVNNFGNPGFGNDAANLEAQSGAQFCSSCASNFAAYNNANFSTPGDGSPGRMRMYEWYGGGSFAVTAPAAIAGSADFGRGLFGVPGDMVGELVPVELADGSPSEGCTEGEFGNAAEINGKLALISRGTCPFTQKVRAAEALGATGVVIHNIPQTDPNAPALINMAINPAEANDIGIPSMFVSLFIGNRIRNQTETVTIDAQLAPRRDSDLDAGIVAHEFGHGLSNRLTGGPSQTSCLSNEEQMGEGWSDYYGLLLTMTAADDAPRGIATYVNFEETDGIGIRNAPYTRDFTVNDYTYEDVINLAWLPATETDPDGNGNRDLTIPHGLGFVWSSMVWDMTLDLTDAHGFDPNVYDADGGAGNQIALNLVTQAMKLQPCRPGFVDGRDAILEADTLLYGGANSEIIWGAFARRGLGLNASQGTTMDANDGTSDFTVPVANERGPNASGARLALLGENPVRRTTTVALTLAAPEDVSLHVLDLLGREVLTLHSGAIAADTRQEFELNARDLAPGVYVVRASGETFSASRRVTIVR